jgi:hypothetical protein
MKLINPTSKKPVRDVFTDFLHDPSPPSPAPRTFSPRGTRLQVFCSSHTDAVSRPTFGLTANCAHRLRPNEHT